MGVVLCCVLSLVLASSAWANVDYLKDARLALASGDLLKLKYAIDRYEKRLKEPSANYTPQDRENGLMWVSLLRAQYHQVSGTPPAFVRLREFETKGQVKQQIDALEGALPHLKAAISHLRDYVLRFRRNLKRASVRDELTIVATTNRIAILRNTVRTVKNRAPQLELLLRQWDQETPAQRKMRIKVMMQTLKRGQAKIQKLQDGQKRIKQGLKQQGRMIAEAQDVLQKHEALLTRRRKVSKILLVTGVPLTIVGAAGLAVGLGLVAYGASDACNPDCSEALSYWVPLSLTLGAVIAGIGVTLVVTGAVTNPTSKDRFQGVYKSHKRYLKWDKSQRQDSPVSMSPTTPPTASTTARVLWEGSL